MRSEPVYGTCVATLARVEEALGAKLDELRDSERTADAMRARSELRAWCAFTALVASALTAVIVLLVTSR
jgi:hypothetical protein